MPERKRSKDVPEARATRRATWPATAPFTAPPKRGPRTRTRTEDDVEERDKWDEEDRDLRARDFAAQLEVSLQGTAEGP